MRQRYSRDEADNQAELFEAVTDRPMWSDLPQDVQATVTELVAQMLRQQRRQELTGHAQEVEHE